MSDLLNMDHINSLPHPLIANPLGGGRYQLESICVETGLLRVYVCGLLDVHHITDVSCFEDAEGCKHDTDTFYCDYKPDDLTEQVGAPG